MRIEETRILAGVSRQVFVMNCRSSWCLERFSFENRLSSSLRQEMRFGEVQLTVGGYPSK